MTISIYTDLPSQHIMDLSFLSTYWNALVRPRNVTAVVERNEQPESTYDNTVAIQSTFNEADDVEEEQEREHATESDQDEHHS